MTRPGALMLRELQGNLLADDADALVNTVNTVGVMGKGIALQFKRAYPDMFRDYEREAKGGRLAPGHMHVWESGTLEGPRYIINFPTKRHWKAASRIEDVEDGLVDLVRVVQELEITSIAIPPLGCGNGGLEWSEVLPKIQAAFAPLAETIDVRVYAPAGAPSAQEMVNRGKTPRLTATRAALLRLMTAFHDVTWEWPGPIEVQKLAYFLQEAGEPLRLDFAKGPYGPYADNLRKTLRDIEGHFITGFGDGSAKPLEADPLEVTSDARDRINAIVEKSPETATQAQRVLELVSGFEGSYDLELLASVHWAATRENAESVDEAHTVIRTWTKRKATLFTTEHIAAAWQALESQGWMQSKVPA